MLGAVDDDPLPGVLLDLDARRADGFDVVDEMPREREAVLLDELDAFSLA